MNNTKINAFSTSLGVTILFNIQHRFSLLYFIDLYISIYTLFFFFCTWGSLPPASLNRPTTAQPREPTANHEQDSGEVKGERSQRSAAVPKSHPGVCACV